MKLYLLIEQYHQIEGIIGIFSSREKAQEAFDFYNDQLDANLDEQNTSIEEYDLDQIHESAIQWPAKK